MRCCLNDRGFDAWRFCWTPTSQSICATATKQSPHKSQLWKERSCYRSLLESNSKGVYIETPLRLVFADRAWMQCWRLYRCSRSMKLPPMRIGGTSRAVGYSRRKLLDRMIAARRRWSIARRSSP